MSAEFIRAVERIRNVSEESGGAWLHMLCYADSLWEGCERLANSPAIGVRIAGNRILDEIGRWRAELLLAQDAAIRAQAQAELVLAGTSHGMSTGEFHPHLQALLPWHTVTCQEQGQRLLLDEEGDPMGAANLHGTVEGFAAEMLRCQTPTEPSRWVEGRGWEFWSGWAELIRFRFYQLHRNCDLRGQIAWARSDGSGLTLLTFERLFEKLQTACEEQVRLQRMMAVLQRPFHNRTVENGDHPLHLEYLRLADSAHPAPLTLTSEEEE